MALTLNGTSAIQLARLTIDAVVHIGDSLVGIVADNVLPRLAPFAENRAPIIFVERTDTFDGVRLFFTGRGRVGDGTIGDRGAKRSGDRIGIRGGVRDGEGGGICHTLTDYPLSGHDKMKYDSVQDGVTEPLPYNEHVNEGFLSDSLQVLLVGARRVQTGNDTATESAMSARMEATNARHKHRAPSADQNDRFRWFLDGARRVDEGKKSWLNESAPCPEG